MNYSTGVPYKDGRYCGFTGCKHYDVCERGLTDYIVEHTDDFEVLDYKPDCYEEPETFMMWLKKVLKWKKK